MFTLYRIDFCSVSKVAPVQCEQEYVHRRVPTITPFQNCSHCASSIRITTQLTFHVPIVHNYLDNSPFTNKRFRCNFCSDKTEKCSNYSLFHGFLQSFVTIGSCNYLTRIISTYAGNTKKSEISWRWQLFKLGDNQLWGYKGLYHICCLLQIIKPFIRPH